MHAHNNITIEIENIHIKSPTSAVWKGLCIPPRVANVEPGAGGRQQREGAFAICKVNCQSDSTGSVCGRPWQHRHLQGPPRVATIQDVSAVLRFASLGAPDAVMHLRPALVCCSPRLICLAAHLRGQIGASQPVAEHVP